MTFEHAAGLIPKIRGLRSVHARAECAVLLTEFCQTDQEAVELLGCVAKPRWPGLEQARVITRRLRGGEPETHGERADFHLTQIRRLARLRRYPYTDPTGELELAEVLRRYSQSPEHAREVIDELLVDTSFCPTPHEIVQVARATAPERARPHCEQCGGTGWQYIERTGLTGVGRCACQNPKKQPAAAAEPGDDSPKSGGLQRAGHLKT